ncbi:MULTISPECIES: hypothetical protein [Streptomyces]|uniref:Uncharacterized protein n=1 Tax=Streptomyces rubradiris TaxID=285531 RepID=A0ABQ3RCB7_STRRR|nr:hypothetical protein [Streptomyces rubradiris]GHG93196.1 hypothetical protein GCM10018792_02020 [Streptomyces rubradiris]GHI53463.1 hypothetical protein Srubr_33090 [Streptomyces rubradiris]
MAVREPGSGGEERPVPRDMPDQQVGAGEDRWDVTAPGRPAEDGRGEDGEDTAPDTDEAGTGPRGAPRTGTVHPEHPGPDESPA